MSRTPYEARQLSTSKLATSLITDAKSSLVEPFSEENFQRIPKKLKSILEAHLLTFDYHNNSGSIPGDVARLLASTIAEVEKLFQSSSISSPIGNYIQTSLVPFVALEELILTNNDDDACINNSIISTLIRTLRDNAISEISRILERHIIISKDSIAEEGTI